MKKFSLKKPYFTLNFPASWTLLMKNVEHKKKLESKLMKGNLKKALNNRPQKILRQL